jgi:hypothetical protein
MKLICTEKALETVRAIMKRDVASRRLPSGKFEVLPPEDRSDFSVAEIAVLKAVGIEVVR